MDVSSDSGHVPGSSPVEQTRPSSKQITELSNAEQLVADYGHLEKGINQSVGNDVLFPVLVVGMVV